MVEQLTNLLLSIVSSVGGQPDFSQVAIAGINIGQFLNSLVTFLITAAVVYFFVVLPYNKLNERRKTGEEVADPTSEELLTEIRDLLRTRN